LYKETSFASHMLDSNLLEHKSEQQVKPASGMSVGDVQDQRLQELAGRGIGVVVPDHGHDLGWVEHGPAGLTHQADQAVLPDLHVGEFPVRPGTEPDLAAPADDHENRAGLTDEGPEQVADHLAGHDHHLQIALRAGCPATAAAAKRPGPGQAATRAGPSAMPG